VTPTPTPTAQPGRYYLGKNGRVRASVPADATVTLAAANCQCDGTPNKAAVFTATGVNRKWTGAAAAFDLAVDAGTAVGSATQVRISYDRTGDGTFDRVETYRYFATDPIAGYERYTQDRQLLSATGTMGNLTRGTIRVEVWNAIGNQPTKLGVGSLSRLDLPLR
jgi:hypothetical protein